MSPSRLARILMLALLSAVLLPSGLATGASAEETGEPVYRLAGGPSLPSGAVIRVGQGQTVPAFQSITVGNQGSGPADIEVTAPTKTQIRVKADPSTFTLRPGESRKVPFSIEVPASQEPGTFSMALTARQTNVRKPEGGGIVNAPGITSKFKVQVVGGAGDVTVNAVNADDGSPVDGTVSILTANPGQPQVTVAETHGSSLSSTIAPGDYVARFDIPRMTAAEEPFSLADGEKKTVNIPVKAVNFVVVAANPSEDGGSIIAVDLIASLKNNLQILPGPVTFNAIVRRDGQEVETVQIQQQPSLPQGLTEVRTSYRPVSGFQPGTYSFEFNVKTPTYTVTASQVPTVVVPAKPPWLLIGGIAAALVVIVLLVLLIARRRGHIAGG